MLPGHGDLRLISCWRADSATRRTTAKTWTATSRRPTGIHASAGQIGTLGNSGGGSRVHCVNAQTNSSRI